MISALLAMLSFKATNPTPPSQLNYPFLFNEKIALCITEDLEPEGRCTGSAYCTACKNCSRCNYCNSGGTCGVCSSGVRPSYKATPKPRTKSTTSYDKPAATTPTTPIRTEIIEEKPATPIEQPVITIAADNTYTVTQETSLRAQPDAKAQVLRRLIEGDTVKVIEKSTQYWWKVVQNGKVGWVKNFLLEKE